MALLISASARYMLVKRCSRAWAAFLSLMSRMMLCTLAFAFLAPSADLTAQTYAPWVTMRITTPDGDTIERTARDSSVATITLKNGTAYELRPTIHDEPFSKVTVAIFKAATPETATALLGEVRVSKGAAAVESRTTPNFKIAVPRIDATDPAKGS